MFIYYLTIFTFCLLLLKYYDGNIVLGLLVGEETMKAVSSMPVVSKLNEILDYLNQEDPILVPLESETYMGHVEIRRFIHDLRQNRQYFFTRNFIC